MTLCPEKLDHATLDIRFLGPPLSSGPLPALFYFAISAKDSLSLPPFCQPIEAINTDLMRIFSISLPFHNNAPPLPDNAVYQWTQESITTFHKECARYIDSLIETNSILPQRIGLMGLSRGVWVACHVALLLCHVQALLGFAPMLKHPSLPSLDIPHYTSDLYHHTLRFYMGNRDKKTSTKTTMDFILSLADVAYEHGIRSAPLELIITPSIGHFGHGTAKETFTEGALWIQNQLIDE